MGPAKFLGVYVLFMLVCVDAADDIEERGELFVYFPVAGGNIK